MKNYIFTRDVLKELYDGLITESEAYYFYRLLDNRQVDNIDEILSLTKLEWKAFPEVNFTTLAQWRYEEWPNKCFLCNKEIDLKNCWHPLEKEKNIMGLVHDICDFYMPRATEDDEETRCVGIEPNLRLTQWNFAVGQIELYDPFGLHLGSINSANRQVYRPAIKGKRKWVKQRYDILKDLFEKKKSLKEVDIIYNKIIQMNDAPNIGWRFGLSRIERVAFDYGVGFKMLTEWRYQGWPKECHICNKPLDVEDLDQVYWIMLKRKDKFLIAHYQCVSGKDLDEREEQFRQPSYIQPPSTELNILDDLYKHKIDLERAYGLFYHIVHEFHTGHITDEKFLDIYKYCNFSRPEATADAYGAPLDVIAKWRHEGWPTKCFVCKCDIDIEKFYWLPKKIEKNVFQLKHTNCED